MRIRFSEISPAGNRYELQSVEGLDEQCDFLVKGPVEVLCLLRSKGDDKVELQGRVKVTITRACDRCLASYDVTLESKMHLLLETASVDSWRLHELEHGLDELDSMLLTEPVVDLDDILRQQIYLMLPVKSLCSESCRGICHRCGANLNTEVCVCATDNGENPFAVLKRLQRSGGTK